MAWFVFPAGLEQDWIWDFNQYIQQRIEQQNNLRI